MMNEKGKVVWSEGMFLRPQHFQQHDRYLTNLIHGCCEPLMSYGWGFSRLVLDQGLLKIGKIALTECCGIFPDGTPFNLPVDDNLPIALDIPADIYNEMVYLVLPLRRPESIETDSELSPDSLARYRSMNIDTRDVNSGFESRAQVQVGALKTELELHSKERSGHVCLGVVRIIEKQADQNVLLDDQYIPPTLHCPASPRLAGFLRELQGLLNARGESLAERVTQSGHGGVAEIADFLLLQLVNRFQPLFSHLSQISGLHPEDFYRHTIQLAGELSTFFLQGKRPAALAIYDHDNLQLTFNTVMEELRQLLGMVSVPLATRIPLTKPKFGIYAAKKPDTALLEGAAFVLAVNAQVPPEHLRTNFPRQIKIGPVEEIHQLVGSALPGIVINPLSVAPRQIPYHMGFTYFELDKHSDIWQKMLTSGGFAFHIGGNFPGLDLEFWAIKQVK
jgi:type VI secretion system protein ImpJ